MRIWVVYFMGEPVHRERLKKDAEEYALQLLASTDGTVQIRKEERE